MSERDEHLSKLALAEHGYATAKGLGDRESAQLCAERMAHENRALALLDEQEQKSIKGTIV